MNWLRLLFPPVRYQNEELDRATAALDRQEKTARGLTVALSQLVEGKGE